MELSKKVSPKKLVGKRIFLCTSGDWKEGTIYTQNNFDYSFIYNIFSNCIGSISVVDAELDKLSKDYFRLKKDTGVYFHHGGKNPFCNSNNLFMSDYKNLKKFLDSSINFKKK